MAAQMVRAEADSPDRELFKSRHNVEVWAGWLKEFRGVGTRLEKLAANVLAMIRMARIRRSFRHLGFADGA